MRRQNQQTIDYSDNVVAESIAKLVMDRKQEVETADKQKFESAHDKICACSFFARRLGLRLAFALLP